MELSMDASFSVSHPTLHQSFPVPFTDLSSFLYSLPYMVMIPTACFLSLEASHFILLPKIQGKARDCTQRQENIEKYHI